MSLFALIFPSGARAALPMAVAPESILAACRRVWTQAPERSSSDDLDSSPFYGLLDVSAADDVNDDNLWKDSSTAASDGT